MNGPKRTSVFPPKQNAAVGIGSGAATSSTTTPAARFATSPSQGADSLLSGPLGITPGADLLVRIDGVPYRLPGARVRRIVELDRILPVPGLPAPAEGVAIAEDHVTVVVRVGASPDAHFALLYDLHDTRIALLGVEVVGFTVDEAVPAYDVEVMFARMEASVWAARAGRRSLHSPKSTP
jgi:hypothetical protein